MAAPIARFTIRPREDIQQQFGRSFASLACPSRSLFRMVVTSQHIGYQSPLVVPLPDVTAEAKPVPPDAE